MRRATRSQPLSPGGLQELKSDRRPRKKKNSTPEQPPEEYIPVESVEDSPVEDSQTSEDALTDGEELATDGEAQTEGEPLTDGETQADEEASVPAELQTDTQADSETHSLRDVSDQRRLELFLFPLLALSRMCSTETWATLYLLITPLLFPT